ncbi:hypothetical protein FRB99_009056 [Tulasnella sp. 403]|nr:hypothetical protein FRB99_009056 [Tulasnella sp. 403]
MYSHLINHTVSQYPNLEPARTINVGDYGTIDKETGDFVSEGNIFSEFDDGAEVAQVIPRLRKNHSVANGNPEIKYSVSAGSASSGEVSASPEVNVSGIASASLKGKWQFAGKTRGAVLALVQSRWSYMVNPPLKQLGKIDSLGGKSLVTGVRTCPAYVMYLSESAKSEASFEFNASLPIPHVPVVSAGGGVGAGWKSSYSGGLYREGVDAAGKESFTALIELKSMARPSMFKLAGVEGLALESDRTTAPPWGALDEDGNEIRVDTFTSETSGSSQLRYKLWSKVSLRSSARSQMQYVTYEKTTDRDEISREMVQQDASLQLISTFTVRDTVCRRPNVHITAADMAPNTFLSRFNLKGHQDPNSRHARMASASSLPPLPTEPSPPAVQRNAPKITPKLVLTTDSFEHDSIQAPATPSSQKRPGSVMLEDSTVTTSPEEARSSEEQQRRFLTGPQPAASIDTVTQIALADADEQPTPTNPRRVYPDSLQDTPRALHSSLAYPETHATRPDRAHTMVESTPKKLVNKPSTSSLRQSFEDAQFTTSPKQSSFEGTRSRSNTQLLAIPNSDDGAGSDTGSFISSSGKKKKKLWRKASSSSVRPSKPGPGAGGLAAAIAASGMSLAHPTGMPVSQTPSVSPERLRKETAKITAPTKPPAKLRRGSADTMDSEGAYDSDSQDEMSFNDQDIPITGFAVASSKRNADFHELFPAVPEGDYLIEDYGCALQREILVQGRLYISENHMCFHANIFGWITNFIIPFTNVTGLEKRMTAFVIPNAIQIATVDQKYVFASFLSRDTTYEVINNIWRLAHPNAGRSPGLSVEASEEGSIAGPSSPNGFSAEGNGSLKSPGEAPPSANGTTGKKPAHRATVCECGRQKGHYTEVAMDTVLPGTPEKIYNLMFASGFVKDFMAKEQKLTSIQISDWYPSTDGSQNLTRNMSYIKPLNGPVGPKQTKCELKDESVHVDFDDYVSTVTTTRTPDVPSGGAFSVKTRTCIMWAGGASTKVVVSTAVEWTGRTLLRSIIERSAIDGQRQYHADLERSMRQYISEHPTEFLPEGSDAAEASTTLAETLEGSAEAQAGVTSPTTDKAPDLTANDRRHLTERRSLQWALDTFSGAAKLTSDSFWGLVDILSDVWQNAPDMPDMPGGSSIGNSGIWWGVVAFLLLMNMWTWLSLRQARAREALTRKRMNGMPGHSPYTTIPAGANTNVGGAWPDGEKDRLAGVATEAVKLFWEGVVERQDLEWRRTLEKEMESLKTTVEALQRRLEGAEGLKTPLDYVD